MIVYYILYLIVFLGGSYLFVEFLKWLLRDQAPMEPPEKDITESHVNYISTYMQGRK